LKNSFKFINFKGYLKVREIKDGVYPMNIERKKIRPAYNAGFYYPNDKLTLERDLSLFLENSPQVEVPRPIKGLIVPHGIYSYAGGVAARAYTQIINQKYDVVVLLAPVHEETFDFISIYSGLAMQTPLGKIEVDRDLAEEIHFVYPDIQLSENGFSEGEIAIELQLPFLKWTLNNPRIVPIAIGKQTAEITEILVNILGKVLQGRSFLIIATTDLSQNLSQEKARVMDELAVESMEKFDADQLLEDNQAGRIRMCGVVPVVVMLKVARTFGAQTCQVLVYRDSSQIDGKTESVIGFCSAIVF